MKSSKNKHGNYDILKFHWGTSASKPASIKKQVQTDQDIKLNLDEYFNFLEQVRPTIQEIRRTIIFKQPFTLT
jgi:hypothetical protein